MTTPELTTKLGKVLKGYGVCRKGKTLYVMLDDEFYLVLWLQRATHTLDASCFVNLYLSHLELREIDREGRVVRPAFPVLADLWWGRIDRLDGFSDWKSISLTPDSIDRFLAVMQNGFEQGIIGYHKHIVDSVYNRKSREILERLVQRSPNLISRVVHIGSLLHVWGYFDLAAKMYSYCFNFDADWAAKGAKHLISLCEKGQPPE